MENNVLITILTPTFNRANLLTRLYESLCRQTIYNFEWILIDDGSTDETSSLAKNFLLSNKFQFKYLYKNNGGKHTAINRGIDVARGEYIFIVDSDDFLPYNSIEIINNKIQHIKSLKNYNTICGICGEKQNIGSTDFELSFDKEMICNNLEFRYKYKIKGDKAEVFKTEILRQFKFPEYNNEKFCPEALVWDRISSKYNTFYFPEVVYYCEYQEEGLTARIYQVRRDSPRGTLQYYKELSKNKKVPIYYRLRGTINFYRFKILTILG